VAKQSEHTGNTENTENTEKAGRRGRKPEGVKLVDKQAGSERAKQRLKVILQTLNGEITVAEACSEIGINESAFYKMRERFLAESVESLEPRKAGRKPREQDVDTDRQQFEQEIEDLASELHVARVKAELASEMPELFRDHDMDRYFAQGPEVKKKARKSSKKKKRSRRLQNRKRRS